MGDHFYYFGCIRDTGHYIFPASGSPRLSYSQQPWKNLDGGLAPGDPQAQGRALVHHKDGWTALAFWDRSVDGRSGSNSAFLADSTLTFDQMMTLAKGNFPEILGRFKFPIVEEVPRRALSPHEEGE